MKRFYTVKEAADILGFSTNTVYKYLDEGKLKAKRIGQGRFKIIADELEPYLSTTDKVESIVNDEARRDKISLTKLVESIDNDPSRSGDFNLFRIFVGLLMIGVGVIYFFWNAEFKNFFPGSHFVLYCGLILGGILFISLNLHIKRVKYLSFIAQVFSVAVFSYACLLALYSGNMNIFLFSISFLSLLVFQLIRRLEKVIEMSSIYREFMLLVLIGVVYAGIFTTVNPNFFALGMLSAFAEKQRFLFFVLWNGILALPIGINFWKTPSTNNKFALYFLPLITAMAGLISIIYINKSQWDVAYSAFLFSVEALFLLWWKASKRNMGDYDFHSVLTTFSWVAAAILLSLLSIYGFQEKTKDATILRMQEKLSEISKSIDQEFGKTDASVNNAVAQKGIQSIIFAKDSESAIAASREIYESIPDAKRVTLYDIEGIGLGVYPRNSQEQGANYSSREYFRITKTTLRPYVSNLYESVVNSEIVIKTTPVFNGNDLIGMVGVAYDLDKLTQKFQSPGSGGIVYAYDVNYKYILNPDSAKIGSEVDAEVIKLGKGSPVYKNGELLRVYDFSLIPRWNLYIERDTESLLGKLYATNLIFALLIYVNAGLSLTTGFRLAKRDGK